MIDWFLMAISTISGALINYSHQTTSVSNSFYPVTPPSRKVSIIIPAYNEEAFIERTILTIQSQNIILEYPEMFEIIVVDNESTDNTVEIASALGVKVIWAPRGVLNARDAGVHEAEGEIIVYADADGIYKPNYLNLLLRHFENPDVGAVSGGFFDISNDLLTQCMHIQENIYNSIFIPKLNGAACAFRKTLYYEIGGHDLSVDQFNRDGELQREAEEDFARRFKQVTKVVWDLEANVWVEPRIQYCASHNPDELCTDPACAYCREVRLAERF